MKMAEAIEKKTVRTRVSRKPMSLTEAYASYEGAGSDEEPTPIIVKRRVQLDALEWGLLSRHPQSDRSAAWADKKGGLVEVISPQGETVYVNCEGYTYARYIGIPEATPAQAEPKKPSRADAEIVQALERNLKYRVEQATAKARWLKDQLDATIRSLQDLENGPALNSMGPLQGNGVELDRLVGEISTLRETIREIKGIQWHFAEHPEQA